jgi:hypothetical protein
MHGYYNYVIAKFKQLKQTYKQRQFQLHPKGIIQVWEECFRTLIIDNNNSILLISEK